MSGVHSSFATQDHACCSAAKDKFNSCKKILKQGRKGEEVKKKKKSDHLL